MQYSEETANRIAAIGDSRISKHIRFLDTVGDGSGTKTLVAAAALYMITPPSGAIFVIEKLIVTLGDNGVLPGSGFGAGAALTNGCLIEIRSNEGTIVVKHSLTDNIPIKTNAQLASLGETKIHNEATGSILQTIIEGPYQLNGNRNDYLAFQTQDSLATLTHAMVSAVVTKYTSTT